MGDKECSTVTEQECTTTTEADHTVYREEKLKLESVNTSKMLDMIKA